MKLEINEVKRQPSLNFDEVRVATTLSRFFGKERSLSGNYG